MRSSAQSGSMRGRKQLASVRSSGKTSAVSKREGGGSSVRKGASGVEQYPYPMTADSSTSNLHNRGGAANQSREVFEAKDMMLN